MDDIRSRLDRILDAQHGGGVEGGPPPGHPFLVVAFWVTDGDLTAVGPDLEREPGDTGAWATGRYRGVNVYPLATRPVERSPWGLHRGVWFGYVRCLHVD